MAERQKNVARGATFSEDMATPSLAKRKYKSKRRRSRKTKTEDISSRIRFVSALNPTNETSLRKTVRELMVPGKGILAADDSTKAINEHMRTLRLEPTEANRRRYHEFLFPSDPTALSAYISGALIREESLYPSVINGKKIKQICQGSKIKLGLRLDKGVVGMQGTCDEWSSVGLDKVDEICKKYAEKEIGFALWRCFYKLSDFTPSKLALKENSTVLARFATICQAYGIVPIVSPEVLNDGNQDLEQARQALREILTWLAKALNDLHVYLEGVLVRISAASPGKSCKGKRDPSAIALATLSAVNESLPPAIGGVLLAKDDSLDSSVQILNEINKCHVKKPIPISFCYSHVIQDDAIPTWAGRERNLEKARVEIVKRAMLCSLATWGQIPEENYGLSISNISVY